VVILPLALTAMAFAVRASWLDYLPSLLAGDEAAMGLEGQAVLHGTLRNWFGTGLFSHPALYYVLQAVPQKLLGSTVSALRVTSAVAGSLAIPAVFVVARRWWSDRVAMLSAAFLATYPFHVHYSRLGLSNVWDSLAVMGTLWWLDRSLDENTAWSWACLGVTLGLSQYGYWGSRALPLVVAIVLLWERLRRWGNRRHDERRWVNGLLGFALAAGPMAVHLAGHAHEWYERYLQIWLLQGGGLEYLAEARNVHPLAAVGQQVIRSLLAFHYYTDASVLYGAPVPLLDFVSGMLFAFGAIALARERWRQPSICLVSTFGVVLLFGSILLTDPPSSQRLVVLSPLLCIVVALGLDRLLSVAQNLLAWNHSFTSSVLALVVVAASVGGIHYYFGHYSDGAYFLDVNSEVLDLAGRYLSRLDLNSRVFVAGAPRVYGDSPAVRYLAPQVRIQDVLDATQWAHQGAMPTPSTILLVPERRSELELVRQLWPQGRVLELRGRRDDILLVVYELL
jgi:4-amino-4-deoxy-L-arabinose transferase-like glycosyltransferase